MSLITKHSPFHALLLRLVLLGGTSLVSTALVSSVHAEEQPRNLSDKVSEELQKLKPLMDAKNWDGAIALLNSNLAKVDAKSYDALVINQALTQNYVAKNDMKGAIPPMEAAVNSPLVDPRVGQELTYYLSQLYLQAGNLEKAQFYMERWIANSKQPTADARLVYAYILYGRAVADPKKIDINFIRKTIEQCQLGLRLTPKPRKEFYDLLMGGYQSTGEFSKMAEVLEILARDHPENKQYWDQLSAIYLNLEKDDDESHEMAMRAALSIERAQQHGLLKTPRDYVNLVSIYFNMQHYDVAAAMLEKGLKDGTIENDSKHWELLYQALQLQKKDNEALRVLHEASKRFPKNGDFDFRAGGIEYGLEKYDDAFKSLSSSIAKGGGEKPENAYLMLAYTSYEMKRYDEALAALDKAEKLPNISASALQSIRQLRDGIKASIAEVERASKA